MVSRRGRLLPAVVVLPVLLTGCVGAPESAQRAEAGGDFPVDITSCGFTSTVTAPPERAVTLNQPATEVMLALGLQDRMAGTAFLDDEVSEQWQEAYESVPVLAAEYPSKEALQAVDPDFLYASFASAFGPEVAGSQAELAERGIWSYLSGFGCAESAGRDEVAWDSVWQETAAIAAAFGVPDRAQELQQEQEADLAQLEQDSVAEGLDVFWYDSGDRAPFAGGGAGGPQLIIDAIGGTNIFADISRAWAEVSWEQVVQADPDVIVLADAAWSTAEGKIAQLESDPALRDLRAVQAKAFVEVPFSATAPGVRLVEGAQTVGDQIAQLAD